MYKKILSISHFVTKLTFVALNIFFIISFLTMEYLNQAFQYFLGARGIYLQEFPWALPLGIPSGKGLYLTIHPLSRSYTDTGSTFYCTKYVLENYKHLCNFRHRVETPFLVHAQTILVTPTDSCSVLHLNFVLHS